MHFFRIFVILAIFLSLFLLLVKRDLSQVSEGARLVYLREARVWRPTNISAADLAAGPQSSVAFPPEANVTCRYLDPPRYTAGFTPKFSCKLQTGEVVRIKFSSRDTLGEIAGTRLLWALGFYTDEIYPVQLKCQNCPEQNIVNPSRDEARIDRLFSDAILERTFNGETIEQFPDQGWRWSELDQVSDKFGGATRAQIDALKLLAVFMQHTDSKPSQQRIGCYEEDMDQIGNWERCRKPVLMLQDLGATFGVGNQTVTAASTLYWKGWQSQEIWKEGCVGNLQSASDQGLTDPAISEEGRKFLAHLLNQLSDRQIRDLFRVARAEKTGEKIDGKLPVTLDHWVSLFKEKRQKINEHRCLK